MKKEQKLSEHSLFGKNRKQFAKYDAENKKQICEHDFRYSHIEYPPMGTYSAMPPNREVVVCRKCGKIIKTILV